MLYYAVISLTRTGFICSAHIIFTQIVMLIDSRVKYRDTYRYTQTVSCNTPNIIPTKINYSVKNFLPIFFYYA